MNRQQRRQFQSNQRTENRQFLREQRAFIKALPDELTPIPREEFPDMSPLPVQAWRSRHYMVQLYDEPSLDYPGLMRMSIHRVRLGTDGRWQDGITWDELQDIKRAVGFGDWYAVEVYPPDAKLVNVANIRHLWLLQTPLRIGWV